MLPKRWVKNCSFFKLCEECYPKEHAICSAGISEAVYAYVALAELWPASPRPYLYYQ